MHRYLFPGGLFTWPNQDDQMNMTEMGEQDQKSDNDELKFLIFGQIQPYFGNA